jgi:hypothetical protein
VRAEGRKVEDLLCHYLSGIRDRRSVKSVFLATVVCGCGGLEESPKWAKDYSLGCSRQTEGVTPREWSLNCQPEP